MKQQMAWMVKLYFSVNSLDSRRMLTVTRPGRAEQEGALSH
jgi:hypothetical protein